jgi:hypothetical protein
MGRPTRHRNAGARTQRKRAPNQIRGPPDETAAAAVEQPFVHREDRRTDLQPSRQKRRNSITTAEHIGPAEEYPTQNRRKTNCQTCPLEHEQIEISGANAPYAIEEARYLAPSAKWYEVTLKAVQQTAKPRFVITAGALRCARKYPADMGRRLADLILHGGLSEPRNSTLIT